MKQGSEMTAEERNNWIDRSTKYLRLVAEHIETIVITTKTGDTITFRSSDGETSNDLPTE